LFSVSDDEKFVHGDVAVSANTNGVDLNFGNLLFDIVSRGLEVRTALSRILSAGVAIYVVVVVTVRNDKQNLLNASATKFELFNTKTHTSRDGGTAAAAGFVHISACSTANKAVN